jgi:tetratricopeptide (TPR) repeat protein
MKGLYNESIESARIAIRQDPAVAEPHFFLADSLRLTGALQEARAEYQQYLQWSDFESSSARKVLNYWVRGFLIGGGRKREAGQKDIWTELRSRAYLGLGECDRAESKPDAAISYYEKALALDKENPQIYWALGLALTRKAELTSDPAALRLARRQFLAVIELNKHLEEAAQARELIAKIDAYLSRL